MSERTDKLERAKFLAVQKLRREDEYAADVLDHALLLERRADGSVSIHCPMTPEGDSLDIEIGEFTRGETDSASEDALADRIVGFVRSAFDDGAIPRYPDIP